jgi:hypothetical protein
MTNLPFKIRKYQHPCPLSPWVFREKDKKGEIMNGMPVFYGSRVNL